MIVMVVKNIGDVEFSKPEISVFCQVKQTKVKGVRKGADGSLETSEHKAWTKKFIPLSELKKLMV